MTSSYWFQGEGALGPDVGDPINQSLRFRTGQQLKNDNLTLGNGQWTISLWTKITVENQSESRKAILATGSSAGSTQVGYIAYYNYLAPDAYANNFSLVHYSNSGASTGFPESNMKFSDPTAWNHLVFQNDGTSGCKVFVNGVLDPQFDNQSNGFAMNGDSIQIGGSTVYPNYNYDGYIAEVHNIDGQLLEPTAFGRYNREGVWVPVKPDFSMTSGGEKYSSYLTVSNGNQYGDNSLAFNGDLDPTGSGSGRIYTDVGATLTWAPEPAVPFTTSLELYNTNAAGQNEATWDGNTAGANGGWITVYTGSGEVSVDKPLVMQGLIGRAEIHAIRIDGELVNDPFIWSSMITDTGFGSGSNVSYFFQDNTLSSTFSAPGPAVFTPTTPIQVKEKVSLWVESTNVAFGVNGGDLTTAVSGQYTDIAFTGDLTQVSIEWGVGEASLTRLAVDGVQLIDGVNNSYGANGFHLDFSDPNDLGADRSGNGNDFTATGFNTDPVGIFSNFLTSSSGFTGTSPATMAFNGNTGNSAFSADPGSTLTWAPNPPVNVGTQLMVLSENATGGTMTWNGTTVNQTDQAFTVIAGTGEVSADNPLTYTVPNTTPATIAAIAIDNQANILVDNTGTDYDLMLDSPSQNFATLNAVDVSGVGNVHDANLSCGTNTAVDTSGIRSSQAVSEGRWYFEVTGTSTGTTNIQSGWASTATAQRIETTDPNVYGMPINPGSTHMIVLDREYDAIWTGENGTWDNGATLAEIEGGDTSNARHTGVAGYPLTPMFLDQASSYSGQAAFNFGQQPFLYQPPEGFKTLQTQNLPSAPIPDGGEHFRVLTGDGPSILSAAQGQLNSDNGTGFQRALWWIKQRNSSGNHQLLDIVRGGNQAINSDNVNGQGDFVVPNGPCVAWCWKAGETTETNNQGTTTTQVSANQAAGFSIITYTAPGSETTVGHGLSQAPELIISKRYDGTASWAVYHEEFGGDYRGTLNENATFTPTGVWGNTDATNTVYTLGAGANDVNTAGENNVAYCFHSVPGYSKVDMYVGNGQVDGPMVNVGFKPAFVMIKATSRTGDWVIYDAAKSTYNPLTAVLTPNAPSQESSAGTYPVDFLSNGFKIRDSGSTINGNVENYVYLAIAQHPQGATKLAPATAGFVGPVQYSGIVPGMASSLRFRTGSYLNRSIQWGSNTTYSVWLKRAFVDKEEYFVGSAASAIYHQGLFLATNQLQGDNVGGSTNSVGLFRDTTSWYHIVYARGDSNTRLYVNGREVEYNAESSSSGAQSGPIDFTIGGLAGSGAAGMAGYMSNIHFVDGQQLGPEAFGEYNENGVWVAKEYTGSYGDWGFHLIMDPAYQSGTMLLDQSGNDRHFSMYGFSLSDATNPNYDWMRDGPASNYSLLNPLPPVNNDGYPGGSNPFLDANCKANSSGITNGGPWNTSLCIQADDPTTYYAEFSEIIAGGSHPYFGVIEAQQLLQGVAKSWVYNPSYYNYHQNGTIGHQPDNVNDVRVVLTTGESYTTGDIIGVAYNAYDKRLEFYKNGVLQGTVERDPLGLDTMFVGNLTGAGDSYSGNWGQRPYTYPTVNNYNYNVNGLTGANFPVTIEKPSDHFGAVTYTGTGTTNSINSLDFQPDFVWIKDRTDTYSHQLFDVVRGATNRIFSNLTNTESTDSTTLTSFDSNGFSLSTNPGVNNTNDNYVAWCWKAGGAAVTNNDGTIESQVSANTDAGFSIVSWNQGTNTTATIGHGLSKAPELIIVKNREDTSNWHVYHVATGSGGRLRLNTTDAFESDSQYWNNTDPTSSVFTVGNGINQNVTQSVITYCWHSVPGYSKFGRFVGSGTDNGPYVHCGFRPRYIMYKNASNAVTAWDIIDLARSPANPQDRTLSAESTSTEETGYIRFDILSQGFKARSNFSANNQSGSSIIFMAFAEMPPQSSLAV